MIQPSIKNETARLRQVILGLADDFGGVPALSDAYDPKSKEHILKGTYPSQESVLAQMDNLEKVLSKYDVDILRPTNIEGINQVFARDIGFVIDDTFVVPNIIAERKGLGTAYIAGFKWGLERTYAFMFEMDADFSHNPEDLIKLYYACARDGSDLAIGSRYVTGVNVVNWPMSRVLMSFFASKYVRFITQMPVQDTTAGFKCFRRNVLETIDLDRIKFVGYAFQIEMKFKTWKYGFKVIEVPIIFTDRTRGTSKMSSGIFKEAVLGVIQLKFNSFFRKYNKLKE